MLSQKQLAERVHLANVDIAAYADDAGKELDIQQHENRHTPCLC